MVAVKRKLKPAIKSVGHSKIYYKVVPLSKLKKLAKGEKVYIKVKLKGRTKRKKISKDYVKSDRVGFYKRSDTKKIAVRNYAMDKKRKAKRHAMTKRGYTGD